MVKRSIELTLGRFLIGADVTRCNLRARIVLTLHRFSGNASQLGNLSDVR